jgi:hypothetical protein
MPERSASTAAGPETLRAGTLVGAPGPAAPSSRRPPGAGGPSPSVTGSVSYWLQPSGGAHGRACVARGGRMMGDRGRPGPHPSDQLRRFAGRNQTVLHVLDESDDDVACGLGAPQNPAFIGAPRCSDGGPRLGLVNDVLDVHTNPGRQSMRIRRGRSGTVMVLQAIVAHRGVGSAGPESRGEVAAATPGGRCGRESAAGGRGSVRAGRNAGNARRAGEQCELAAPEQRVGPVGVLDPTARRAGDPVHEDHQAVAGPA